MLRSSRDFANLGVVEIILLFCDGSISNLTNSYSYASFNSCKIDSRFQNLMIGKIQRA